MSGCTSSAAATAMVNDAGWQIDQHSAGGQAQTSHRLLALNHYFTKSREEWRLRRALGKADKTADDPAFFRADAEFAQHDINAVRDDRAALFMQAARALFYLPPRRGRGRNRSGRPAHLLSAHGTLLCWDGEAGRPAQCPPERLSPTRQPLRCEPGAAAECRLLRPEGGALADRRRCFVQPGCRRRRRRAAPARRTGVPVRRGRLARESAPTAPRRASGRRSCR